MKRAKEIFRQGNVLNQASYWGLAFFPVVAIAAIFLRKILAMKHFVFGDDIQLLQWFHEGRIAFPLREIVSSRLKDGRFFPLFYENLNVLSLLNPHLSLENLAEHCFFVQAVMWLLCCTAFLFLMTAIAKKERPQIHPVWWLFVPLALLTLLCTPACVAYFLMLIFAETRLCVLFPLFFLFYYLGWKKENTAYYVIAWGVATFAIFCKENVIAFFAVICGVWGVFGWKLLTRTHKIFLAGLLASIAAFLLLYYFIVYHNTVEAYNAARTWGTSFWTHVGEIFCTYPVWIFGFLLGFYRLIRVAFCREKTHLFMDGMLFAVLGYFLSYLVLKLTDWWYWGVGAVVLLPVFFYWLVVCEKAWGKAAICLAAALCLAVTVKPACERVKLLFQAQEEDPAFLKNVDSVKGGKRIVFPMLGSDETHAIEDACYQYLKLFLEKLGTPGKWQDSVIAVKELPKWLAPEDLCVVWRGAPLPPEMQSILQINGFECIGVCNYYMAYACNSADLDMSVPDGRLLAKEPFFRFGNGFAVPEDWGRWTAGSCAELAVFIPPELRGKALKMNWEIFAFVHEKSPVRQFRILSNDTLLYEGAAREFNTSFTLNVPAKATEKPYIPLEIELENPVSPAKLGISDDPRQLGIGVKSVTWQCEQGNAR